MAVLTNLPDKQRIDSLKGTLDFYYWKGIPCCRKWPHWPKRVPYPTEKINQDDFAHAMALSKDLPANIREAYQRMVIGVPYRWQDLLVRGYMSGIHY